MNQKEIKTALTAPLVLALGFGGVATIQGCTNPGSTTTASSPAGGGAATAPQSQSDAPGHEGHNHAGQEHAAEEDHTGHNHGPMSGGEGMSHAMGTSGIEALKLLNGKDFDIAFMSQMITHHEAAVSMAEQALKSSQEPATKQEAQKVVASQTKEIKQMTDWLKKWYGVGQSAGQQGLVEADMKSMMAMPLNSDRMFFEMMIPHHQGAIDMSKLVPERTERAEVKQLAKQIMTAQEQEIEQYKRLIGTP